MHRSFMASTQQSGQSYLRIPSIHLLIQVFPCTAAAWSKNFRQGARWSVVYHPIPIIPTQTCSDDLCNTLQKVTIWIASTYDQKQTGKTGAHLLLRWPRKFTMLHTSNSKKKAWWMLRLVLGNVLNMVTNHTLPETRFFRLHLCGQYEFYFNQFSST